jgi:hypothetical protein
MPLSPLSPTDSIESTLTCKSEDYQNLFKNEGFVTTVLCEDALRDIIRPNSTRLRAANKRYRLDILLSAMITHAPHYLGKRYVAICLHIAHDKDKSLVKEDKEPVEVVNAAKAWLDNLLLPSP